MLRSVRASARLQSTREELYSILVDFGRYSRWLPGLEQSRILTREGDVTVAELSGRRFSDRTYNLELIRSAPETVIFRQIDCLGRPEISGQWRVGETELDLGTATAVVHLQARVDTPMLRLDSRRRIRSGLHAALDALAARRRQLASARPTAEADRRKVLEVVRDAAGLKVWYLGESFLMPREDAAS